MEQPDPKTSLRRPKKGGRNKEPIMNQADEIRKLKQLLREEIIQLRQWAIETEAGNWSSHQVEPMQRRANDLELELARLSRLFL